jgi:hypothetical protein
VSVVRGVESGSLAIETQHNMSEQDARTYGASLNACLESEVSDDHKKAPPGVTSSAASPCTRGCIGACA